MFKFERFGGFNNKRNHVVQFKTRDRALSPSILGVASPKRVVQQQQPPTTTSSSSNADPFEFPPTIDSLTSKKPIESKLDNTATNKKILPKIAPTPPANKPIQVEEEDFDDVFEFPDIQESREIKLMVAANRPIPENHSKKTAKKLKANSKKKGSPPTTPKKSVNAESAKKPSKVAALKRRSNSNLSDKPATVASKSLINSNSVRFMLPGTANTMQTTQPQQRQQQRQQQNVEQLQLFQRDVIQIQPDQELLGIQKMQQFQQEALQQQQHQQDLHEQSIFDIFDFDFNPKVHIRHNSAGSQQQGNDSTSQVQIFSSDSFYTTPNLNNNDINNIHPQYDNPIPYHNNYNAPLSFNNHSAIPMMSIDSVLLDDPVSFQQVNEFLDSTPAPPLSNISNTPHVEKKRKRNLVAHLKSASGENVKLGAANQRFDFLSDEEESALASEIADVMPFREFIQKERSMSPELTYAERMELELEVMMNTEFGGSGSNNKEKESTTTTTNQSQQDATINNRRRPRYQPQNKMNVKFTFEKKT